MTLNIGRFLMSKFFILEVYTAWTSLEIIYFTADGYCLGITAIISSDFSKLIVLKDISKAKRYAWLSMTIVLVFTFGIFGILYAKRVFLAEILIDDKDIQRYFEQ